MGSMSSKDLISNDYLLKFSGVEHIHHVDPFWNIFLSFSFTPPRNRSETEQLDAKLSPVFEKLYVNNLISGNVGSLLQIFLFKTVELLSSNSKLSNLFLLQMYNSLFILRSYTRFMLENIKEIDYDLIRQFDAKPLQTTAPCEKQNMEMFSGSDTQINKLEIFLNALIEILVDVPLADYTYSLHLEAINCLLVLLSTLMYMDKPASKSFIYRCIMQGKDSIHSPLLVKTLLGHFVRQQKPPERHSGSLVVGLASGLWHMLTLGYGGGSSVEEGLSPLASQSLLLILVLVNHCTAEKLMPNPYREALFTFTNSHGPNDEVPTTAAATFKFDLGALYNALCSTAVNESSTLLLYLLLHRNENVKTFILSRADIELLIVPILQTLYKAADCNSHHIYMSLIILLIFSEDTLFSNTVHKITIKNIAWYSERGIGEISLGGLLILVVIRTIHYNMVKMRDKYLHTNCLAALANMSSNFSNLHAYVCQRLLSLFETLAKKYHRLEKELLARQPLKNTPNGNGDPTIPVITPLQENCTTLNMEESIDADGIHNLAQDVAVLEEVLRMVLEIINSCLINQLQHNHNLIYALLYKQHIFDPFRSHNNFQEIFQNLDAVINYFSKQLQQFQELSVNEVLSTIVQGTLRWPAHTLKKFPELKFKYVEEDQPEDFFIPYVWSLVTNHSGLSWDLNNIKLFLPENDT